MQSLYMQSTHRQCICIVETRGMGRGRDAVADTGSLQVNARTFREYRTEEEFKSALRSGDLRWTEIQRYVEWRKSEIKNCQIAFRISGTDLMKLKALARMQGKKYQTYMSEILKREIHAQEDRLAGSESDAVNVDSQD